MYLRQSTAAIVSLGPFIDDTDFKTLETGLSIANTDIKLIKNGASSVNKNSGGAVHDVNGMYSLTLDVTDTNTVGRLLITCKVSGALACPPVEYQVLEEAVYDALFAASAGGYTTTSDIPTAADISDAVWDEATADHVGSGSFGLWVGTDFQSQWTSSAAQIGNIESDTNELQTNQGNWLTATGFSTHSAADVWTVLNRTITGSTSTIDANITRISGDSAAADNCELFFDGTGYNAANSTIGTCTTNTDMRGTDNAATAANLATVDTVVDTIQLTTDKLDDTLEDNAGVYRFTEASLENVNAAADSTVVVAADGDYVKGNVATFYLQFVDAFGDFVEPPVFVAGDVKVSVSGVYQNIATLPTVTPTGSSRALVTLSATETNQDNVSVKFEFVAANHDAADVEWMPITVELTAESTNIATQLSGVIIPSIITDTVLPVTDRTLTAYTGENAQFTITPVDASGNAIDASSKTFRVIIEGDDLVDIYVIENGSLDAKGNGYITFTVPDTVNTVPRQVLWSVRRTDDSSNRPVGHGRYVVKKAADGD